MKRIDKYLFSEFLQTVAYCLTAFCLLFVIADLFGHMGKFLSARATPLAIVRYYGIVLVQQFEFLAPAALMLGALYTLWQFSRNNEIIAMRACGLSMGRIMAPLMGVAAVFAVVVFAVGEWVAPRYADWAERFARNGFRELAAIPSRHHVYYNEAARRFWSIDEFDLAHPTQLKGVKITQETRDGVRERDLLAERAEFLDGQWWLLAPRVQRYDARDNPVGLPVPLRREPKELVELPELTEQPRDLAGSTADWSQLSLPDMYRRLAGRDPRDRDTVQRWFDFHRRLAMPWACLVVTLFGIPAGAGGGRRSALAGVFLALCFFLAFYILSQVGLFLGKRQVISPWLGAWLSNIVFMALGLGMAWRSR